MCQPHWDMLRQEIADQGLRAWVAPDGETAVAQLVDGLKRGEDTPVNYDPLMSCNWMLIDRAMQSIGLMVMHQEFGCPICYLNEHIRGEDGSCKCGHAECPNKEPGSVPDFETWLVGPDGCVSAAKAHMVAQGWIGGEG